MGETARRQAGKRKTRPGTTSKRPSRKPTKRSRADILKASRKRVAKVGLQPKAKKNKDKKKKKR